MTIQWQGNDEEPPRREPPTLTTLLVMSHVLPSEEGRLPSARSPRDVATVVGLVLVLLVVGAILWFVVGPLPRVFPLMS